MAGHAIIIQHFADFCRGALFAQILSRLITQKFLIFRKVEIHGVSSLPLAAKHALASPVLQRGYQPFQSRKVLSLRQVRRILIVCIHRNLTTFRP